MTPHEVRALVERVSLKNPPFPITLTCWPFHFLDTPAGIGSTVQVAWSVRDRDSGGPIVVNSLLQVAPYMDEKMVLHLIERKIWYAFEHEFDECFHVDGVRVRDPHSEHRRIGR